MFGKYSKPLLLTLIISLAAAGWSVPAGAVNLNIPAISMTPKVGTLDAGPDFTTNTGLLDANGESGVFVAPVDIPANQLVCQFELWARNFEDLTMTARLIRKRMLAGTNNGFGSTPQTMAEVSSSAGADGIQRAITTSITSPIISASYQYWVELEFSGGFYQAQAIRVVYKTTC